MTRTRTARTRWFCGLCALLGSLTAGAPSGEASAGQTGDASLRIVVLSAAKPHLVSGGDVLVRVDADDSVRLTDLVVLLDDVDVTRRFRPDPDRHALLGLVPGLTPGDHTLVARALGDEARQQLTSYPMTGPMISGPHEQPFHCQTEEFTLVTGVSLGAPLDEHCSIDMRVAYVYRANRRCIQAVAGRRSTCRPGLHHDDRRAHRTVYRAGADRHREPGHLRECDPARPGTAGTGSVDPKRRVEREAGLYARRWLSQRMVSTGTAYGGCAARRVA